MGLKKVAEHAGVSVKTVSNVVRGTVRVAPSTRERVERSLAELGYRPNLSARQLRQGRTGVVALAVPALDAPYFSALARAAIRAAAPHGWTVLIEQTDGLREREVDVLDGPAGHLVDGVVLSPLALGAADLEGRRPSVPIVLLGERVFDGPDDHVAIDNVTAAREATAHLLALGRRRVAAVGAQDRVGAGTAHLRLQGYREAHRDAGLEADPALVASVDQFDRASGAAAAAGWPTCRTPRTRCSASTTSSPSARCGRWPCAACACRDDVAVAGFDDIEDGAYSVPSLTTVRPTSPGSRTPPSTCSPAARRAPRRDHRARSSSGTGWWCGRARSVAAEQPIRPAPWGAGRTELRMQRGATSAAEGGQTEVGLHEPVGPQRVHLRALGGVGVGVGARRAGATAGHQLAARAGVGVRQAEHVTRLVGRHPQRVVLLVLRVVEEDVAVAVAVAVGVRAAGSLPS